MSFRARRAERGTLGTCPRKSRHIPGRGEAFGICIEPGSERTPSECFARTTPAPRPSLRRHVAPEVAPIQHRRQMPRGSPLASAARPPSSVIPRPASRAEESAHEGGLGKDRASRDDRPADEEPIRAGTEGIREQIPRFARNDTKGERGVADRGTLGTFPRRSRDIPGRGEAFGICLEPGSERTPSECFARPTPAPRPSLRRHVAPEVAPIQHRRQMPRGSRLALAAWLPACLAEDSSPLRLAPGLGMTQKSSEARLASGSELPPDSVRASLLRHSEARLAGRGICSRGRAWKGRGSRDDRPADGEPIRVCSEGLREQIPRFARNDTKGERGVADRIILDTCPRRSGHIRHPPSAVRFPLSDSGFRIPPRLRLGA